MSRPRNLVGVATTGGGRWDATQVLAAVGPSAEKLAAQRWRSGRVMPSRFMRLRAVLGVRLSSWAAPCAPSSTHPVRSNAASMCRLSTSSSDGGFELEVSIIHPGGVNELYLGRVKGPRIDLVTDAVVRTASAKEYAAATRLYGLVDDHLLWAWDIAALGQDLRTHASGRLARVE